ncbi:MAG: RNA-binding protein [Dongiaceae bacterium]
MIGDEGLAVEEGSPDMIEGEISPSGKSPLRRCISSREILDKRQLIRFVLDPAGQVVPDLKNRLPGRGLWVKADRAVLAHAVKINAFAKAARQSAKVPGDLIDRLTGLLQREVAELIGLAKRSGNLVVGFDKFEEALRAQRVVLLVQASDGAPDGRSKLARLAGSGVEICTPLTVAELAAALGRENAVHVALRRSGIAERLSLACHRLTGIAGSGGGPEARKTE